jgi:hypothetical protein
MLLRPGVKPGTPETAKAPGFAAGTVTPGDVLKVPEAHVRADDRIRVHVHT